MAGESAMFFFSLWGERMAGGGKIGEKRPNRIQIFCSDSWTQENLRPKKFGKTNMFIFLFKKIGRLVVGIGRHNKTMLASGDRLKKTCRKKPASNVVCMFLTFICLLGDRSRNKFVRTTRKSALFCLFVFFDLALETSRPGRTRVFKIIM